MNRSTLIVAASFTLLGSAIALTTSAQAQQRPGAPVRPGAQSPNGGIAGGTTNGPDVIVSTLAGGLFTNWGAVGGIAGYSFQSVSCNLGEADAEWFEFTADHPVIGQTLYRLKDGRFEQIGLGWLKHGFCAADSCLSPCGPVCESNGSCDWLGTFATDTYSNTRNGDQITLGPRSEVNPWTGVYPYPYVKAWNTSGNATYKRMQVANVDVDPAQNSGALYFADCQYVCTDEQAINRYNNVSYRRVLVGTLNTNGAWNIASTGSTVQQQPAINAWKANDGGVSLVNIDTPNDGRMILAFKASPLITAGLWHYEYALYNMNCDRSAGSFGVPIPTGVTVSSIGFHDISYHSGETYSSVDWPGVLAGTQLQWATSPFTTNPDANAIRWGTMYNFRFDSPYPPKFANVNVGLFKPGTPGSMTVRAIGPTNCSADIAPDGVGDGTVNTDDLLMIVASWGACTNVNDCPADIAPPGGNDSVNTDDLLLIVGSWGGCP